MHFISFYVSNQSAPIKSYTKTSIRKKGKKRIKLKNICKSMFLLGQQLQNASCLNSQMAFMYKILHKNMNDYI